MRAWAPVMALLAAASSAEAAPAKVRRLAWLGVAGGPLSPARAEALEALLLDELDGYDSFRVVDAAGNALDERLLASEAARAAKLLDEGVDLALNMKHKKAVPKLDQAIEVFESRLTSLRDHELLHDALLAKAEALEGSGNRAAATETLKQLAALNPKKSPSKKTHSADFVALWDRARDELGVAGRLEISADGPPPTILVDGTVLGKAPVEANRLLPGKHYLVARWPFYTLLTPVQVSAGRDLKLNLMRKGPSEEARLGILELVEKRRGMEPLAALGKRVADLASADGALFAAVRSDGGALALLLALTDESGRLTQVVRTPIQEAVDAEATAVSVRHLGAAIFVNKLEGELDVGAKGEVAEARGLSGLLFGRPAPNLAEAVAVLGRSPEPKPPPPPEPRPSVDPRPAPDPALAVKAPVEPNRSILKEWWFWVGVGAALVGTAVVGGAFLLQPDPTTTEIEFVRR